MEGLAFLGQDFCQTVLIEGKGILEQQLAGILGGKESLGKALRQEGVDVSLQTLTCDAG